MKKLFLLISVLTIAFSLTACGDNYDGLDAEVTGVIDLMLWSGSGTYYEDLGNMNLATEDLLAQNDAAAYYIAKEFNKTYPNVQINLIAHAGGPTDGGRIWAQELANYDAEHGAHPGIWATEDLPGDIEKGIVADLSRFETDPLYMSMNPSIMQMMNYYGFQGGLPQYILPWGIFVNRELAENQNLDVPEPDWDIDEYTDFIGNSEEDVYYGSMDTPIRLIETGTNTLHKSLFNYDGGSEYVDLNSDEVRDLLPYISEWNENSVWGGAQNPEFMDAHWWWSYKFFIENKLLTLEGDPWMMGDCAHPDEDWWGACISEDWDIYPRPSTDFVDNNVGIVLDPMAVYNHCLDDGNLACSAEEELKIQLSYTFASFWIASTDSWNARASQQFIDVESQTYSSSLNDSFPVTTGDLFNEQMNVWYSVPKHARFADESVMPGFHEVIRIYEEGQFWDISDKSFPYFYDDDGTRRPNMEEWKSYYNSEINGGVEKGDSNFIDTILGNLSTWNTLSNERFAESWATMLDGMDRYYPDPEEEATETE